MIRTNLFQGLLMHLKAQVLLQFLQGVPGHVLPGNPQQNA